MVGVAQAHLLFPSPASGVTGATKSTAADLFSATLPTAFPCLGTAFVKDRPFSTFPAKARARTDSAEASEEQGALSGKLGCSGGASFLLGGGPGGVRRGEGTGDAPLGAPAPPPPTAFLLAPSSSLTAVAAGFSGVPAAAGSAFRSGFGDGFRAFAGPDLALLPPGTSTGLASTSGAAMLRDRTLGAPAMEAISAQAPELLPPKNSNFTAFSTPPELLKNRAE